MNANIIPFNQMNTLPAHFAGATAGMSLNDAAEEFASVKFPVISTKGGRFHVKRDGEKTLIMRPKTNPNDPNEPATYLEVAILNLQKSKTYYESGYTEGAEDKPTCFSNDGITPDSSVDAKQCATCALCPHNAWGSGSNEKGEATKGKACSDVQRLAVAAVGNMADPMMFRVPPASLKNLAEMSKFLSKKNIPLNGVVVRVSFDTDATGVIKFEAIGYLDADNYAKAQAMMNDDLVLAIVGKKTRGVDALGAAPAHIAAPKAEAQKAPVEVKTNADLVAGATEAADAKAKAKAAKIAAAQAALAAAAAEDEAPAPAPEAPKQAAVATSSNFDEELANLLS